MFTNIPRALRHRFPRRRPCLFDRLSPQALFPMRDLRLGPLERVRKSLTESSFNHRWDNELSLLTLLGPSIAPFRTIIVAGGPLDDRKLKGRVVALLFLSNRAFLRFSIASFSPLKRYSTHPTQSILFQNNTGMVGLKYCLPTRL